MIPEMIAVGIILTRADVVATTMLTLLLLMYAVLACPEVVLALKPGRCAVCGRGHRVHRPVSSTLLPTDCTVQLDASLTALRAEVGRSPRGVSGGDAGGDWPFTKCASLPGGR